jgi:hypothetical protein
MNSSLCISLARSKSCNSFRRTLLQRMLHKFSALATVTHFDGITCRQNGRNTRKSFSRLLLPLFVPITPLGAHSYENIGGTPLPHAPGSMKTGSAAKYQCYVPLTRKLANASKKALCFLPLTDHVSCNSQCYLPLTKKGEGGGRRAGGIDRAGPSRRI